MNSRGLVWIIYAVVFSTAAVAISMSGHAGNALFWVIYGGLAAIVASVLSRRGPA